MQSLQTHLSAAKAAVIKALEQNYIRPVQMLIECRINALEAAHEIPELYAPRDVFGDERYASIIAVFTDLNLLMVHGLKKLVNYSILAVTMTYGSVMDSISSISREKRNIAVNVVAAVFLAYLAWRIMSLVTGYALYPSTGLTSVEGCQREQPRRLKWRSRRRKTRASRGSTKHQKM